MSVSVDWNPFYLCQNWYIYFVYFSLPVVCEKKKACSSRNKCRKYKKKEKQVNMKEHWEWQIALNVLVAMSCEANISTLLFPRTSIKVIATIINSILYLRKLRHREFKNQYLAQLYTTSKWWSESSDSVQEFVLFLYMQNLLNILSLIFVFPL